ncbi:hypothetical protein TNCV_3135051 [Trichonephila clavipes]|nr:hypothetical protein TNCV_3135051 [Trichonephila clavipes]
MSVPKRLKTTTIAAIQWYVQSSTLRVDLQQGFRYRVLLGYQDEDLHISEPTLLPPVPPAPVLNASSNTTGARPSLVRTRV